MQFAVVGSYLMSKDGQSNFLINIVNGLVDAGESVDLFCLGHEQNFNSNLSHKVKIYSLNMRLTSFRKLMMLMYSRRPYKKLGYLINKKRYDCLLVLHDQSLPQILFAKGSINIYISQGDLNLILLNKEFKKRSKFILLLYPLFVFSVKRNSKLCRSYNMILANSHFTQSFMSLLYDIPFNGFVYPPINFEIYKKVGVQEKEKYFLALLRNNGENAFQTVTYLSSKYKIKVVGGATVKDAENLGYVSQSDLTNLYRKATATLALSPSEFFGYHVVESMACGTPVITFDLGGPSELVKQDITGWKLSSLDEINIIMDKLLIEGVKHEIQEACMQCADFFTTKSSAEKLINYIEEFRRNKWHDINDK